MLKIKEDKMQELEWRNKMRLTQKHDFFEYVLPCQNVIGDNQATEIQLGDTEYTAKKYIVGEAIKQFGLIEDILEKWNIEDLDKFIDNQIAKKKELNDILWKMESELAELKQKAIVPKYNLKQTCFIIWENDIISAQIEKIIIKISKDDEENSVYYSITNQYGYALRFPEEQIFATKEEAEQKLTQLKGKE